MQTAPASFRVLLAFVLVASACGDDRSAPAPLPVRRRDAGPTEVADEQARFDQDRRPDLVVAALALRPGARVADVGAGSGLLTVHLARAVGPTGKVVATDIDAAVLDLMRPRLVAAGVDAQVERRRVPADEPGLAPDTFDAILLAEVDHYLGDPVRWLAAAAKQLSPGGRLVITNRIYHRAAAEAAAAAAGLRSLGSTSPTPSHFIAVYGPPA